ncbi:MAG TPA: malto-oligosyltrehalose synthase [Acidimicrobiales bacterium]|nr:malto-oligosyltrehalose synthase [Acidimicrobiales bacterium]
MIAPPDPAGTAPRATYRVQLHAGFGFDDVAAIAPYLAALGVSHVYCSPYLQAARGSTHGYDVVDHRRLNAELGGEEAHRRMTAALAAAGLSTVLDIVPNHMATAGQDNAWWWDVLENGPSSRYADAFDVDWPSADPDGPGMLLPVLGDHYGRILEAGELRVTREGARFVIRYHDHGAPVAPRSLTGPLTRAAAACGSDELATIANALAALPPPQATDRESVRQRHRDKEVLLGYLDRLFAERPAVGDAVDEVLAAINADPDALDALLARQNFRLAYWRLASSELAYRRFFDITTLVGLRMEAPHVFDETHALVLDLVARGAATGLRVDHPDGLRDPEGYLRRLYEASGGTWIVVEKILEPGEELPPSWPVAGTTGYDFLNLVGGLFVDPAGEEPLTELHARFTGTGASYHELVREKKHLVMRQSLGPDVHRVTDLAAAVCRRHRRQRDHGWRDLDAALRELVACFPVYRTYVQPGRPPTDVDAAHVAVAVEEASGRRPDLDPSLFAFLADVLLLRVQGPEAEELVLRFQQLTGPVMAKGAEDTAFYCYRRLVSLNEVGGDPGRFGTTVEEFHRRNRRTAAAWPSTLLALSTHDTKRSGDVRARIGLLSEIPDQWALAVRRWARANDAHKRGGMPDRGAEYLLYQTVVGAWPLPVERAVAYMGKATKEAKENTSWINPDPEYDAAVRSFVEAVLGDPEFTADLASFVGPLVEPGRVTSLAQTLLTLTAPGCPDVYQGTELWDLSLVDPDNRRPVAYDVRRALLDKVVGAGPEDVLALSDDGAPKLWLLHRALGLRRTAAPAFAPGSSYTPLPVRGTKARHAVAYARGGRVVVVVPRLVLGLAGDWGDTTVELPPGPWTSVLDGGSVDGGAVAPADLLARFPVALLTAT